MGTDNSAVNDEVFHIRVLYKMLMSASGGFPYTFITPTGKAFVDAVPLTVMLGQQSPGSATACNPQDGLQEAPAIAFLSNVEVWT